MSCDTAKGVVMNNEELNKVKSDAVMNFVNTIIAAYECGFIESHESNISDVYQCAAQHVKLNYKLEVKSLVDEWGDELAEILKHGE